MKRDELPIMIIDDMSAMRMVIKGTLHEAGFTNVIEQSSAEMALNSLNANPECCQLVLTDWVMPHMSGFDFLYAVRTHSDARIKRLKVIMVTAEASKEKILKAQTTGINGYILKPFTSEMIEKAILRVIPSVKAKQA